MVSQHIQQKNEYLNAALYVDYENIHELLKRYGVSPLEINFFPIIIDKFKKEYELDLIECNVYGNFERKSFEKHQSFLHNLGLQTYHTVSQGKNCGDLMLTVDTLTTLYKNPFINIYVVISSDRDMIPLLKAIKRENKSTFMLTTKYGFNQIVCNYADYHEYIEDIFNLTPDMLSEEKTNVDFLIKQDNLSNDDIQKAKEVSKLLYSSHVWKTYEVDGNPVTLNGYLRIASKKVSEDTELMIRYFELAHHFKYITIYKDQNKGLCIKKGDNYKEILGLGTFDTE